MMNKHNYPIFIRVLPEWITEERRLICWEKEIIHVSIKVMLFIFRRCTAFKSCVYTLPQIHTCSAGTGNNMLTQTNLLHQAALGLCKSTLMPHWHELKCLEDRNNINFIACFWKWSTICKVSMICIERKSMQNHWHWFFKKKDVFIHLHAHTHTDTRTSIGLGIV